MGLFLLHIFDVIFDSLTHTDLTVRDVLLIKTNWIFTNEFEPVEIHFIRSKYFQHDLVQLFFTRLILYYIFFKNEPFLIVYTIFSSS